MNSFSDVDKSVGCVFVRDEGDSAVGTDHLGRARNWKVWGELSTESIEHHRSNH